MNDSLGMIETKGLLATIVASDTMLKSADIHLVGVTKVGGGLTSILIKGDVSAVTTAVSAAESNLSYLSLDSLVSSHVIARTEVDTHFFIDEKEPVVIDSENIEEVIDNDGFISEDELMTPLEIEEKIENTLDLAFLELEQITYQNKEELVSQLTQMKVVDLRKLAKHQIDFSIARKELYKTSKEKLVEALSEFLINNE
ncbi:MULTISPECIES: BMC domain-containing protein [Enterococcaceae]|uniref:BMC domain-containing protein n=1 Tax=Enterococcaceae TaxID=81852 RepID=UPI000E4D57E2|nr:MULTISPECIES: BMC domain-containing protein [Enterococcaceae]MCI0130379.1 BMC domain-containing protein [Vagococcus sp. CY53-2]RGI32109.1 BMC domain-containing protein [Melissococcus sp. OM08-11BH]UNM89814.1 BMC domain-containing protein [Vagococcus sp. CY52-2]